MEQGPSTCAYMILTTHLIIQIWAWTGGKITCYLMNESVHRDLPRSEIEMDTSLISYKFCGDESGHSDLHLIRRRGGVCMQAVRGHRSCPNSQIPVLSKKSCMHSCNTRYLHGRYDSSFMQNSTLYGERQHFVYRADV